MHAVAGLCITEEETIAEERSIFRHLSIPRHTAVIRDGIDVIYNATITGRYRRRSMFPSGVIPSLPPLPRDPATTGGLSALVWQALPPSLPLPSMFRKSLLRSDSHTMSRRRSCNAATLPHHDTCVTAVGRGRTTYANCFPAPSRICASDQRLPAHQSMCSRASVRVNPRPHRNATASVLDIGWPWACRSRTASVKACRAERLITLS
jgi:hypothetical protein